MKFQNAFTVASLLEIALVAVAPRLCCQRCGDSAELDTFNTLLAAATATGLAETLATTENITVFAPTD